MKKIIFAISMLFAINTFAQSNDSLSIKDTTKNFQYRIRFEHQSVSFDLENQLFDIFKTKPEYNRSLDQYILISIENIEEWRIKNVMSNNQIVYFKKFSIN